MNYRQIAADLAERIASGEYPPGSQLPTGDELAALYSVSVTTIDKVMTLLVDRGVVDGVQGLGRFVAETEPDG